jgi:hypothetical protein
MDEPQDATAPSGWPAEADRLLDLAFRVLATTPGFLQMVHHPELHDWAIDLARFGERDDLRPMAGALAHVISEISTGQGAFRPLLNALNKDSSNIDWETLFRASVAAEESTGSRPYASFLLAWATLAVWILRAAKQGESLYGKGRLSLPWQGWPHPGWATIPAACAGAAIKLDGLYGAQLLAAEAYAVLQSHWRRSQGGFRPLEPVIAKYHQLEQTIGTRYDSAIASLSDALRDACRNDSSRARSFLAALLWSLGLIPECRALQENSEPPSRRLLRQLIQTSIQVVPDDPLIQYLWLEIKDDICVNLRAHRASLAVINHDWDQWLIDDGYQMLGLDVEPSRLYARTLEALLAGKLDKPGAAVYLQVFDLISDSEAPPTSFIWHRMMMLRHLIAVRFNFYGPQVTEDECVTHLKKWMEVAGRERARAAGHPEWPDILGRTGHATFELIEHCLAEHTQLSKSEAERCALVLETLERHRTAALTFWLQVNRPLVPLTENDKEA